MNLYLTSNHMDTIYQLQEIAKKHDCKIGI